MNGYSEDLREKIVTAVRGGLSKSQAAHIFGVSLSSIKRYVNKAEHGESLAPRKSHGAGPKLHEKPTKLLEPDLNHQHFAALKGRRHYIHYLTGLSVSR